MKLSSLERRVLRCAAADLRRLKNHEPIPGDSRTIHFYGLQEAVDDARRGFVRLSAARWLGQPLDARLRMAVSRTYTRLEEAGLVKRAALGWGVTRCSHLRLMPKGLRLVESLTPKKKKKAAQVEADASDA